MLGLGAVLSLRQANQSQQAAVVVPPVAPQATFTPSPTITPIPLTPTNTPEPTSTATLVVGPTAQEAAASDTSLVPPAEATTQPNETPQDTATPDPNVTATNTLVLRTPEVGTPTPAAVAANPPAQIPQGGGILPANGGFLIWAGLGVLLLLILGLVHHLRSPASLADE